MSLNIEIEESGEVVTVNTICILCVTKPVNIKRTYNLFERLLLGFPKEEDYWRFRIALSNVYLDITREDLTSITEEYKRILEEL